MDSLHIKAYAKINLGLDVLRRRPDGYHEVKMIMQTVGIHDDLGISEAFGGQDRDFGRSEGASGRREQPDLEGGKAHEGGVRDCGRDFCEADKAHPDRGRHGGRKRGCGGNDPCGGRLFGLGLTLEQKQAFGVKLGADIPYCLMGGTALSEGIGEILTALPDVPQAELVIAKPDLDVSTKFVYENLHADRLEAHPDIDGMAESIRRGRFRRGDGAHGKCAGNGNVPQLSCD